MGVGAVNKGDGPQVIFNSADHTPTMCRGYCRTQSEEVQLDRDGLPKESACQRRVHRFNPWSGKIPMPWDSASPCATVHRAKLWEPRSCNCSLKQTHLELVLHNKRSHRNENPYALQ